MSKQEKLQSRLKRLERDNERLVLIVRGNTVTRDRLTRELAQVKMQNRLMRKGWRGPWRRLKAWWRTRRKR